MSSAVRAFLATPSPDAWFQAASADVPTLLVDHANCEKKAAGAALSLMYRYVEVPTLLQALSRLAREELRHFEQVHRVMTSRGIRYVQLPASAYAGALHAEVTTHEPLRLLDLLLVGAIVEARSCERFERLAPRLDDDLAAFYEQLAISEARHFERYLELASAVVDVSEEVLEARLAHLLAVEAQLVTKPSPELRFHSGPLMAVTSPG